MPKRKQLQFIINLKYYQKEGSRAGSWLPPILSSLQTGTLLVLATGSMNRYWYVQYIFLDHISDLLRESNLA